MAKGMLVSGGRYRGALTGSVMAGCATPNHVLKFIATVTKTAKITYSTAYSEGSAEKSSYESGITHCAFFLRKHVFPQAGSDPLMLLPEVIASQPDMLPGQG